MSSRTIMITGGAGFIGSHVVRLFVTKYPDYRIVNVDALTYAGNLANLTDVEKAPNYFFERADITDEAAIEKLFTQYQFDGLIHLAAESHVDRSIHGPGEFIQTNVLGTFNLLECVRAHWTELPEHHPDLDQQSFRFLHVSTDEVYGSLSPTDAPFKETNPYEPNSPYSASKASSDHLVRAWHHTYGLPVLTTNCSNNYGPYHFPEKLIPLVILNALAGKPLPIYGDGQQVRDWLYVEDHCRAIARVLEAGKVGECYNIGGWNEKANLDVVRTLCGILDELQPRSDGKSYSEQIAYVKDRPGHDRRYAMDASKMQRELGWKPLETFETGIRKTVKWYLANQSWVEGVTSGAYRQWLDKHYGRD